MISIEHYIPKWQNTLFFSSAHGTFSNIDHILGHKSSIGKFKNIETVSSMIFYHNAIRLDIDYGAGGAGTVKNTNI